MDSHPSGGTHRRFSHETRPPAHLEDYEVQYPGVKGAACQTECECPQHTTSTHRLQDESKREEEEDGDGDGDVPINKVAIMKELLVTMRGIQRLMDRSSTPCSSSSKCSSKSGSSTASKYFVHKLPVVSKVENQAVQLPS